nr:MAG TPA: recombination protein [Caudoviricetes sp.]
MVWSASGTILKISPPGHSKLHITLFTNNGFLIFRCFFAR